MSEDLIKRSDAIKAVAEVLSLNRFASFKNVKDFGRFAERMLRNVPSADRPQGEWIPCSERLPVKAGHYLCSFKKAKLIDNIYVDLAYWTGGRWYGYVANEINAWMPLPKTWKGADDVEG